MIKMIDMGRSLRISEGGFVYHVLNRGNARRVFLRKPADFDAFERVVAEAKEQVPMRILAYCLMPNHWHLLLWPQTGPDLSRFVGWLTLTHTQRWHAHYHNVGTGHLYQGRFKSFPVQEDNHLYTVCRYIERNALRANLVAKRAEEWRWCSLWQRLHGVDKGEGLLNSWPIACPPGWTGMVNEAPNRYGVGNSSAERQTWPTVWG
jgi:putative transposase